jgi:hypothetical protein
MTSLQRELAMADASRKGAGSWSLSNPHKLLLLPAMRVIQEFRPHGPGELYVLAFAVLGILLLRQHDAGRVFAALLFAAAIAVGLTWSTAGRFLVPLLFILHAAAGIGLWAALLACTLRRERSLGDVLVSPASQASPQAPGPQVSGT